MVFLATDRTRWIAAASLDATGGSLRKISVAGSITTDEDRSTTLVSADGIFVVPDPERARALFPSLRAETPSPTSWKR